MVFCWDGCLSGIFGLALGLGIGAYNAAEIRPCLDDTTHCSKVTAKHGAKKGAEYASIAATKGSAAASSAAKKGSEYAASAATKARVAATPYMQQLSDKVARKTK
eukprot:TRINITY_DN6033_c0_g2_i1.p2 TRINITY_DN6033_c0_g2~~TRINITY_DN6033_c0_g2_i1.p2  ORF type:complete len:105 (+),score=24.74 TRINITY_DN6033_c0_g2_i1:78-392(+)